MSAGREMGARVAFRTLGCKLNQHESDSLAEDFRAAGYELVPFEESADVYVLNTCTVTNKADRKSRNLLYRTLRATGAEAARDAAGAEAVDGGNDDAPLVVLTGCFAESHKNDYAGDNRFLLVDNPRKARLVDLVEARRRGELTDPHAPDPDLFGYHASSVYHTRSSIKVQDGCNNFCTFCIVPYVRGTASSRPAHEVLADATRAVEGGARELVLTGVNMSRYDHEGIGFSALLERLLELPGEFRLRISSLEPDSLDDRFFALLAHPKMCPHLHLCLQSGSDRILLKMRRQYDTSRFSRYIDRIRRTRSDFNFTTDILVGFPGETEEDFEQTAMMARRIGFSHIHTFPYSVRERTRAARMTEHVPAEMKAERAEIIRGISLENKRRYRGSLVGTVETLLTERTHPEADREHGYGEHYVPIRLSGDVSKDTDAHSPVRNEFLPVRLTGLTDDEEPLLLGEALTPARQS
ncbi:MAG: tRNA (N(6)-L-threonylcarbamoyladenosine(37)-C(2))-methylthiotransferase MtaB [Spirochaetes bacterium]|jgi:threonylcarbamoyladenosine tRNA methylthiotransferase MtaB|nr:tRNA (N(6)-L-threonylcarbamoyladenosine(37)-C(2))-methylthiotransferase MtaB [Spirochaetota bacterium]